MNVRKSGYFDKKQALSPVDFAIRETIEIKAGQRQLVLPAAAS